MQVSGIQSLFSDVPSQSTQTNQSGGSFNDYLDGASGNGVQAFMDYMKETPAQQMFTSFLGSQHISQSQYDAMTPQQQEALMQKFEQQLKLKMETGSTNISSVNS
jgi:hypothetical protein